MALVLLMTAPIAIGSVSRSPKTPSKSKSHARRGSAVSTKELAEAQDRLAALGFWLESMPARQALELRAAIMAFQKLESLTPTGRLDQAELSVLDEAKAPRPKETGAPHWEVDLDRQVIFWVGAEGAVSKILPVSTGSGKDFTSGNWTRQAVTPVGRFYVSKKLEGWQRSPLGMLYYPNFIVGGIAIHGAPSVPGYPASHGCIRIPMFAAKEFSDITPVGAEVLVYGTVRRQPEPEDDEP